MRPSLHSDLCESGIALPHTPQAQLGPELGLVLKNPLDVPVGTFPTFCSSSEFHPSGLGHDRKIRVPHSADLL